MEGYYYFGEYLRWNLWFPNPNVAGAFVATVLAWTFPYLLLRAPKARLEKVFYAALMLSSWGLWFVLIKTYSRGAFVSAVAVWGLCGVFILSRQWRGMRQRLVVRAAATVLVVCALAVSSGFLERVSPGHLAQDGSVQARGTLWRGVLAMIADAPATGWGAGQSGQVYMDWYQPLDDTRRYGGTVNSYLFVAAEYGLPVLWGALAGLLGVVFAGRHLAGRQSGLPRASRWLFAGATASLLAFACCNLFSTLWIFGGLWWIPSLAALIVLVGLCFCKGIPWKRIAMGALGLAFVICLSLYGCGAWLGRGIPIEKTGNVIRYGRSLSPQPGVLCLFDNSVCGPAVGKMVRRLGAAPALQGRCLYAPVSAKAPIVGLNADCFDVLIASGGRCSQLSGQICEGKTIYLVNPMGIPDMNVLKNAKACILVLGEIDEHGQHARWLMLSQANGWKVQSVMGGQKIDLSIMDGLF